MFGLSYTQIGLAALVMVVSTVVSTAIVVVFLLRIAPDHFVSDRRLSSPPLESPAAPRARAVAPLVRAAYLVAKNLLGVLLVAIGVVLSVPGVPGQGLLTILVGVLLLDLPGKRAVELSLVRRPAVLRAVNRLRDRLRRPPLLVDPPAER